MELEGGKTEGFVNFLWVHPQGGTTLMFWALIYGFGIILLTPTPGRQAQRSLLSTGEMTDMDSCTGQAQVKAILIAPSVGRNEHEESTVPAQLLRNV